MKRKYDFNQLVQKHNFNIRAIEKACKVSDILEEELINKIPIDTSLKNLLQTQKATKLDFKEIKEQTINFSKTTIANITKNEIKAIDQFFEHKKFEPNLIDDKGIFHEKIKEHTAILWALRELVA